MLPIFSTRPILSRPLRWPDGPAAELSCNRRLGYSSTTAADNREPVIRPHAKATEFQPGSSPWNQP
eukprot:10922640-Lingulodinium_polyedra.AAC.1